MLARREACGTGLAVVHAAEEIGCADGLERVEMEVELSREMDEIRLS